MEDKCPFCGAAEIPMPEGRFYYACGTYGISEEGRSGQCWKEELAALQADLREAVKRLESFGPFREGSLAQAFLTRPSVRKVMEEKG